MQPTPKSHWNIIVRWAGTLISLAIMGYLLYRVGWRETWATVRQLSTLRIVLVVLLVFISRLATFARWHTLLQVEQMKVHWKDSLKLTFAGLFASNVLPTTIGGDVARLAGAVRMGISTSLAAASLVADRVVGMAGMTLVLPFAIGPAVSYFSKGEANKVPLPAFALTGFLGKSWEKIKHGVTKVLSNFKFWYKHPLILLQALGFTLVHQLSIYLIITILIEGMGSHMSLAQIAGIWSLTYFISLIPISINGLGLQEVTITNLYSILGGLPTPTTISLAIILRVLWLIGSLPGAFVLSDVLAGNKNKV